MSENTSTTSSNNELSQQQEQLSQLADSLEDMKQTVEVFYECLEEHLVQKIYRKIHTTHSVDQLELILPCPKVFFHAITEGWVPYEPQRARGKYDLYRKCSSVEDLKKNLPDLKERREFRNNKLVMEIHASDEKPIRAIYSSEKKQLVLTFWYQQTPLPAYYHPVYRGDSTKRKKQLYFCDLDKSLRPNKQHNSSPSQNI